MTTVPGSLFELTATWVIDPACPGSASSLATR